jgi:CubicO group peptidase (beta-lactamase class C family)
LPATVEPAGWPTEAWPVSTPEEQGMDSDLLADLVDAVVASGGIDSVMVVRNGYTVLQTVVYPFPENTGHIVHSCAKGITATLIGIAIDRGLLAGVDVPVVEILADRAPETVDQLKASMTVEDLLTMSTGLDCRDSYLHGYEGMVEMQSSDDWTEHVLALPMAAKPGRRFEYCNGSSLLLSAILSEVTGQPASEFAAEVLFAPLGITDFAWSTDPEGVTIGWGELMLQPPDMAKLGLLYLRDGEWDGGQLVPPEWVAAATTSQIDAGTLADGYGYQWWIDDDGWFMAQGFGGQHIIVIPDKDLVVTYTAALVGEHMSTPQALTADYLLAAVLSSTPLAPNPDARARLAAALETARSGPEPVVSALPEMAATIDGVRYDFRPNDSGNTWFSIRFEDGFAVLSSEDADGITDLEIGLNGRYAVDATMPVALRGEWRDDSTFAVEFRVIGQIERGALDFSFGDGVAEVTSYDAAAGTSDTIMADRAD